MTSLHTTVAAAVIILVAAAPTCSAQSPISCVQPCSAAGCGSGTTCAEVWECATSTVGASLGRYCIPDCALPGGTDCSCTSATPCGQPCSCTAVSCSTMVSTMSCHGKCYKVIFPTGASQETCLY